MNTSRIIVCCILGLTLKTTLSLGQEQKGNLIIQLDDKLVESGVAARIYIETDKETVNFSLEYYPGSLILPDQAFKMLKFDSIKSVALSLDLYSYEKGKQRLLNVKTNYSKFLMERPYLILNIYDLSIKKNKRELGHLTKNNYVCEYVFPNSGRLIRQR
jgi:hypothetical protein